MATTTNDRDAAAFRVTAYVEALTYLVLLAFVVVYRVFDGLDLIRVPGLVHGIVVLVYFVMVLRIRESQGWGAGETLLILLASALPFGGFWAGRHLT
ncbi:MAG: DUF3817 domain-containing protein [Acidimicrobiales bacterium]